MSDQTLVKTEKLAMLALRGLSVFPFMLLNFDVERPKSIAALNTAMENGRRIFLLAQKDVATENPEEKDLFRMGTVCYIKQLLRVPGGGIKVLVEGQHRAKLVKILGSRTFFFAEVEPVYENKIQKSTVKNEALIRKAIELFDAYASVSNNVSKETVLSITGSNDPGYVADYIAQNVYLKPADKQKILACEKPAKRIELICGMLESELEILAIEQQIGEKLQSRLMHQQRENILREQLHVIQSELGDETDSAYEMEQYREKIMALGLDPDSEEKLLKDVSKLEKQPSGSSEASVLKNYLDVCLELPWNASTRERLDIAAARKILDDDHFGLEKVKERILEFLAVRQFAPASKGSIICLVGPPGVGKTSIAISVARALNRNLARIALGGIHDEAEIRGHRKTYVGAMPGRIITALIQAKSKNPLMLLDEIDKLGSDYRGDPSSALLEALDPEQNAKFRDNFIELPFDLSDVMFITTANTTSTIPRPLLDRMEVIELSSYTDMEKLQICKDHLIPKQRKKHGLTARQFKMSDDAIRETISGYTRESGVRILERMVAQACRKAVVGIVSGEIKSANVKAGNLESYLGTRKYLPDTLNAQDEVGLVRGLAWTAVGGETLEVEVNIVPGTGKVALTGNLGDVMKESANIALTFIRSRAGRLGIDSDFYKNSDIHVHFPEGAVPKDGPSAGITMTMALISALTGAPVRRDIAMTGEVTLRGRILAIGGLKEKTMAALRAGIKTVIIPAENERDLEEIDQTVRRSLEFVLASHVDDVVDFVMPSLQETVKARVQPPAILTDGKLSGDATAVRQ